MIPDKLDHVAYRCRDAKETTEFYTALLDMKLVAAVTASHVPSTKQPGRNNPLPTPTKKASRF
ncbi:MAG: VOC family protein [Rhodospirillaceae bacterium]|jgi:glyoxylase I family protein|nr:VOC family protein [Rhodospirillaceae bacterium]MBT5666952.1 VOC family protein [Rhodospirillaceae bacterium]MBT5810768.1 VOC family protein [Rhodospirillaceae bacterium]